MTRAEELVLDVDGTAPETPGRMTRAEVICPDCDGYGIMGGRGSYYDTPGKGKPCSTCNGRKVVKASRPDDSGAVVPADNGDGESERVGPDST